MNSDIENACSFIKIFPFNFASFSPRNVENSTKTFSRRGFSLVNCLVPSRILNCTGGVGGGGVEWCARKLASLLFVYRRRWRLRSSTSVVVMKMQKALIPGDNAPASFLLELMKFHRHPQLSGARLCVFVVLRIRRSLSCDP